MNCSTNRCDNAALDERADELIVVATEQDFPLWGAQGTIYRGWVKVKNGDVPEGISLLRSGASAYRATGAETWTPRKNNRAENSHQAVRRREHKTAIGGADAWLAGGGVEFAPDSPLEGDGFELPVPREKKSRNSGIPSESEQGGR